MNKYLHIVLSFGLSVSISFSLAAKSNPEKGEPIKPPVRQKAIPAQNVLEQEGLQALNAQLKGLNLNSSASFVPSTSFLKESSVSMTVASARDSARAIMSKIIQGGYFIDLDQDNPPPLNPIKLPVGLKKHFGENNIVYVGFSKAVIKPTHAELTAFVKMEMYVEDGQSGTKRNVSYFLE